MDWELRDVAAVKKDAAVVNSGVPHDGGKQRGLTDAVAPKEGDATVRAQDKRDIFQHDGVVIAGSQRLRLRKISGALSRTAVGVVSRIGSTMSTRTEINFAHLWASAHLIDRPLDQKRAFDQHGYLAS